VTSSVDVSEAAIQVNQHGKIMDVDYNQEKIWKSKKVLHVDIHYVTRCLVVTVDLMRYCTARTFPE